jgi:F0F1-type ATP synthase assembly protein I
MSKDNSNRAKIIKELAPYMTLGIDFAITVSLFALLGYWLDGKYSTSPLWILILSFFGIAVGFYKFIRITLKKKKMNGGKSSLR